MRIRRTPAAIGAAIVACGALAATALAFSTGGPQLQMINQESAFPATTSAAPWVTLGGSAIGVNVPNATTRLINARFTAASECVGQAGVCTVRIIATNTANGAIIELNPVSADFAFDTAAGAAPDGRAEAHAMERSRRLPPGNYALTVQRGVTNPGQTQFRVDDWHFAVEVSA